MTESFGILNSVTSAKRGIHTDINNLLSRSHIGQIQNVNASNPELHNALLWDTTSRTWKRKDLTTIPTVIPRQLSDLTNVADTAPTNGQHLIYSTGTSTWGPAAGGALTAALNDLTNVDTATYPKFNGCSLQFDGTNWITAPAETVVIWATASNNGGDNSNTGLTTGASVADLQTAFQRVLQKGSIISSKINLKLTDVPWSTATNWLINVNLLNGPSFTRFILNGSSQDFTVESGVGQQRTTDAALTGYSISSGGQVISNGWNATTFPTALNWAEVQLNSVVRTIPVVVDEQDDNTGVRIYMSYWDRTINPGFTAQPTFRDRELLDSTTITNSATIYGPISITNLIIKGPDSATLQYLGGVNMQYVELQSTTPASQFTHVIFNGKDTQCRYCRFTSLSFACNGSSTTPLDDSTTTFVNCVFINCLFTEAKNVSFLGCIFYKNPDLFNDISCNITFDTCTFVYSHGATGAAIAKLNDHSTAKLENCVIDLKKYAAGTVPLTIPIFIVQNNSSLYTSEVEVLDDVLNVATTGAVQNPYGSTSAYILATGQSHVIATTGTIKDTGAGDLPLFLIQGQSSLLIKDAKLNTNVHTVVAASNSNILIYDQDNKIKCKDFITAEQCYINLVSIIIKTGGSFLMTGDFLNIKGCRVTGNGNSATTACWIDSSHTDTKKLVQAIDSSIDLVLTPDGTTMDMYGRILLDKSTMTMSVISNGQKGKINLINGTTNSGDVLDLGSSNCVLADISINNTHASDGNAINIIDGSNLSVLFNVFDTSSENVIQCVDGIAIMCSGSSKVHVAGLIGSIKNTTADDKSTIVCTVSSQINIISHISVSQAGTYHTVIQRDSASTGTVPIISIRDESHFNMMSEGSDRLATAGAGAINIAAPELLLKGEDSNTGQAPMLISGNSSMTLLLSKITVNKLNGPSIIRLGSKLSILQCSLVDDSSAATRFRYFEVNDSAMIVSGSGDYALSFTPSFTVQGADSTSQAVILGSNSRLTFTDMSISNLVAIGTNQSVINGRNGSNVLYLNPKQNGNNGFAIGVQLRSNSRCEFKDAGSDQLECTQDILLGLIGGATDNTRKIIDMLGKTILPKQALPGLTDFATLQGFIDEAEGCTATVVI